MNDFNAFMRGVRSTRNFWADWFPVERMIFTGFADTGDDVLMVDIGGGNGQDLETCLAKFPRSHGRLILQDLPGTITNLKGLDEGIQAMSHDFFLPQPVKGRPHSQTTPVQGNRSNFVRCPGIFHPFRNAQLARRQMPRDPS